MGFSCSLRFIDAPEPGRETDASPGCILCLISVSARHRYYFAEGDGTTVETTKRKDCITERSGYFQQSQHVQRFLFRLVGLLGKLRIALGVEVDHGLVKLFQRGENERIVQRF